jgi:hypothetical protein
MEAWKGEIETRAIASTARRNRKQGALKAQLQSAQGSALGKATYPSITAPCKGNYINIKRLKD